jgi:hypothetical protein
MKIPWFHVGLIAAAVILMVGGARLTGTEIHWGFAAIIIICMIVVACGKRSR